MPTTNRRIQKENFVLGADGCRGGWVYVRLCLATGKTHIGVTTKFRNIVNEIGFSAQMIMVDMPIGLCDIGRRDCERQARQLLKPLRHNSVFSSPRRPMLKFDRYEDANEFGKAQGPDAGGGLSKQAWMITPKIREMDQIMTASLQSSVSEAHPEVAFYRLNGHAPCSFSKRRREGQAERCSLLKKSGFKKPEALFAEARNAFGAGVSIDDVFDACAIALTAKARLEKKAICLTDASRDARGLKMEIWG